jgi:haloacetate dehalogenase
MSTLVDLFAGFAKRRIKTEAGLTFVRTGGSGPPLLLLHGFPQTHVCWHKIAPVLARHFTLVLADLRGYGASSAPPGDGAHKTYSKRAMAADCLAVMRALGHGQFFVAGHDRGGRVAYRLALDHPEAVRALVAIDILPTWNVWQHMGAESAIRSYHWAFLAQPYPLPETLISKAPVTYLEHTLKSWAKPRSLSPFSPAALKHYRALLSSRKRVHAVCEDYRAGATIDRAIDASDVARKRLIGCPTYLLWGSDYIGKGALAPLDVWRSWCSKVDGLEIDSGHFLHEENPKAMLAALLPFLKGQAAPR